MTPNLDFKVTPLFHSKHLRNGTRYRPSYCHVIILKCVISRVVTVFETKTAFFFSEPTGTETAVILVPDERFFTSGQQARFKVAA